VAKAVGLRTEILVTITVLMGAALLLGGFLLLRLTEQNLLDQRVTQLEAVSKVLANSLAILPQEEGPLDGRSLHLDFLKKLPANLQYDGWWLYDKNLQPVASYQSGSDPHNSVARRQQVKLTLQPDSKIKFPSLLDYFGRTEASAFFAVPIMWQGRFSGLLELNFSLNDIRLRLLRAQQVVLIYVLLYGSVLVFIGYYLLQRNIIKPARNLLRATEEVGLGNLEMRLPVAGPVEIARLAEAYNRMVEALQHSRQETRGHIEVLEQTNSELQQTRDELIRSEKLASVGQLAAGLAHELGNPLAALIGYLEVLKTHLAKEDNRDILQRSLVETQRIDYLVRELLDYSRPADDLFEEVNPVVELRKCLLLLGNQGNLSKISITDQLPEQVGNVRINRNKLQQVFINILLNAAQACEAEGEIRISAEMKEDRICLEIADDGCGIAPEHLNQIFDPFFTTKSPGEGTGLGLAICQRIIEEAGGRISVQSTLGEGSAFRVGLKLA